jgi:pilus assembly protein CpaC
VIDSVTYPGQTDVPAQLRKYFADLPTVTIREVEGKAVLSGVVDEPDAAYYKEVAGMFKDQIIDLVLIPSKDESIQVDVQVVEVLKENTDDLGIEWFAAGPWQVSASAQGTASTNPGLGATGGSGSSSSSSSGSSSPTASASVSTGSTTSADPGGLSGSMQLNLDNVMFNLIALAQDGKARFLAKPKLLVQNGKKASFLVGGELPIPQTTAFNSTVDWKKFGTQLEISPVIQPANTVAIGLHATVSEFDFTQLVNGYPTLRSREAQTNMRTRSGDTFAIAGLLSNTENTNVEKVPILGDIPVIGYIFKRDRKKISRIETIVFFTPHILAKASAAQTEVSDTILPSQPLRKAQEELNREPDDEDDD